ncbi:hypothetical protein TEHD10_1701 [Tetragenococcus halophilus subsp. halophilus]|uniref:glycosyltransferase family 4 protein n=1 Tax=Tetragenococcus halophilus TaxID=51669 RepID=UPI000CC2C794|nr:glycosyltransferase family 4 protein [Tetragenococcus halophilus]GBD80638.1 hypothetical protein TEHD10_1701 [Tetragenococcus halophilus subsp. halophilus]
MKKKVLIIATVDQHIRHFHLPLINKLNNAGYEVDVASNGNENFENVNQKYKIPFARNPLKLQNIDAYRKLKDIIKNNNYDFIHVNTPTGSAIGRLAAKSQRKKGTRVIYTAHGFHFYKGASLKNWCIFFPIEFWLSKLTDELILINEEDFKRANKFFKTPNKYLINGVGVDSTIYQKIDEKEKTLQRKKLGFEKKDTILTYVAEISKRKNQNLLIDIMKQVVSTNDRVKFLLLGDGEYFEFIRKKVNDYNLQDNIFLLGYKTNVVDYLQISDIYISTSLQEGLPVNVIEAQFCELPCIVSNCRGNIDLVFNEKNGYVVDMNEKSIEVFTNKILNLTKNPTLRKDMGLQNTNYVKKYDVKTITNEIANLYMRD